MDRTDLHIPVLLDEVVHWLAPREDGIYVDCTVGTGGHALAIAERTQRGRLIAIDRDPQAIEIAQSRLKKFSHVTVVHANFAEIGNILKVLGIFKVDGVLIDAGLSSFQLDEPQRGFSFQVEGPLDMRMDTTQQLTAKKLLDTLSENELISILKTYGDVARARKIAREIIRWRESHRLSTTNDLVAAVQTALHITHKIPEEVRTVFQAIRIAVNQEFECLEKGITEAIHYLALQGRIVVISFHSGEDRIVKRIFKQFARPQYVYHSDGRIKEKLLPKLKILTDQPVVPSKQECQKNPRAHSAKLRAAMRIPESTEKEGL